LKNDPQHDALVAACKRGDRRAQQKLYSSYARAMYNICLRMVRNEADAEDLLQNAFIDVFTKIESYRGDATIGAWIKRITINTCINYLKKRRLDVGAWDERISDTPAESSSAYADDTTLTVEKVKRAMNELPDGYRTVFSLYLIEGYDHKEIADVLGISEATSKSQYSRARKKVRELIDEMN
jgi:RNA polymerase sigma-70 factor (ECF subfamily)